MPGTLPTGIGNDQQASQATAFIRQQPWYLDFLTQQGLTPGADGQVKLNDNQRAQLMALSLKNGIGLNHKYDSIDENGQIAEEHHKLKKVAIAAAIAGLALTGFGAAGIGPLAGALGGASAAAGGAGAAEGSLVGSAGGIGGALGTGGAALEAGGAATGVLGGAAAAGVVPAVLAGGAAAAGGVGAGVAGGLEGSLVGEAGGMGGALGGVADAGGAATGLGGATGAVGATTTLGKVANTLKTSNDTAHRVSSLLGATGEGFGQVAHDAASGRLSAAQIALKAQEAADANARTNIAGQTSFETALINRAKEEQLQRADALKNIYRQSYATNRTPGPFNQAGLTKYSPEYLASLGNLTKQGGSTLANAPVYGMDTQPKLAPLPMQKPFDPNEFMNQYGTPGTLEQASNWISPTLSTLGKVYSIYNGGR